MKILVVTPAPAGSRQGNRVTALRWTRFLRELGHVVSLATRYEGGGGWDLMIALHARRSALSVARFLRERPGSPTIVALTGTDLYRDLRRSSAARLALARATRVVVLQPRGLTALRPPIRTKARAILQSASPQGAPTPPLSADGPSARNRGGKRTASVTRLHDLAPGRRQGPALSMPARGERRSPGTDVGPSSRLQRWSPARAVGPSGDHAPAAQFDVCVLGHLRPVKDPFRAAMAARLLPPSSRVRVLQVGAALSPAMERRARLESERNKRYRWLGERSQASALRLLARSRLLVLTSRIEGGANAVSEAIVLGVPVISSRIEGSIGQLGRGYPGFFPPGDTRALALLLRRAETDARFYSRLRRWGARLAPRFHPARERDAWRALLEELRVAVNRSP